MGKGTFNGGDKEKEQLEKRWGFFFHDLQMMADGMLGKGQKDLVVATRSQASGTDATRQQAAAGFKCACFIFFPPPFAFRGSGKCPDPRNK